jgi:hypothetical protein
MFDKCWRAAILQRASCRSGVSKITRDIGANLEWMGEKCRTYPVQKLAERCVRPDPPIARPMTKPCIAPGLSANRNLSTWPNSRLIGQMTWRALLPDNGLHGSYSP